MAVVTLPEYTLELGALTLRLHRHEVLFGLDLLGASLHHHRVVLTLLPQQLALLLPPVAFRLLLRGRAKRR